MMRAGSSYKTASTLKKSRTFLLTKSPNYPSLEEHDHPLPPKKSPVVADFPTSPQLIFGEEMLHFGHPRHPLSLVKLPDLFTCDGCREYGAGKRYVCRQCNFQLHDFCASAPPSLKAHPLHCQHHLVLFSKPVKGGIGQSKCDVCNKSIKGYAFRCSACSFQMHPCCAKLSSEINLVEAHAHPLRLLPEHFHDASFTCDACNRKRSGRVYHCSACNYYLHAVCAKNFINCLHENGIKAKDKTSKLGAAARLASQLMMDFIGGLVEGFAEGVGQVIVQDVTKGRSTAARRSRNNDNNN